MRKRRFIFNNDGTFILGNRLHGGRPLIPQDVTDYVDQMAGTPVTSYFICTNSGMPYYDSAVERSFSCLADGQEPGPGVCPCGEHPHIVHLGENLRSLAAHGTNIVELCVARAHEHGMEAFASMRMNDLHQANPAKYYPWGQGDFWLAHPEFHVGEAHVGSMHANGALNFAHDAVRRYKLDLIEEICTRFDIDGLEMDFLRFPVYFPYGQGERHIPAMTEFVRRARAIARRIGKQRGRPLELAARVPRSLAHCRWLGLDPAAWAQEDLVDFLTSGAWFRDDPAPPLRSFREALGTETLPIYGSMDCILSRPGIRNSKERRTHGMYRASAAHLHREGVDGIYLFNFFFTSPEGNVLGMVGELAARSLLFELGDAEKLRGRNKCYSVPSSTEEYGFNHDRDLPRHLAAGQKAVLTVILAEDLSHARPEQALLFIRATGDKARSIRLNGVMLTDEVPRETIQSFRRDHTLADDQHVQAWEVPVPVLREGENEILVSGVEGEAELLWVDLAVLYGPPHLAGWY